MNVENIRKDFPVLQQDEEFIYFDNACLSLKPRTVIDAIKAYYEEYTACGGRSMHQLSKKVDERVHTTRKTMQKFLHTNSEEEIVFSKNTTESVNLVAHSFPWEKGDVVLTSDKEHNSNLIPWQQLAHRGVAHKVIPTNEDNTFNLESLKSLLSPKVKLLALGHTSNLDGVTIPLKEIITIAHDNKTKVFIDAAQSAPHQEINVKKLDVDFLACSGHKMLGPTGTGVLYGKMHELECLSPFITGGETVIDSFYDKATFEKPPHKFEAGLQNYAGIIGLNEAAKYLMHIREDVYKHELMLNKMMTQGLGDAITVIGPEPEQRGGILSFTSKMNHHDTAIMLDQQQIFIRSGAHCVHSWFNARNVAGSARASVYLYNTKEEVNRFVEETKKILALA